MFVDHDVSVFNRIVGSIGAGGVRNSFDRTNAFLARAPGPGEGIDTGAANEKEEEEEKEGGEQEEGHAAAPPEGGGG